MPRAFAISKACYENGQQAKQNFDYTKLDAEHGIYILADGIGHGKDACVTQEGLRAFVDRWIHANLIRQYDSLRQDPGQAFRSFFDESDRELADGMAGIGALCTIECAYVAPEGGKIQFAHAGDSVSLIMGKEKLRLLSEYPTRRLGQRLSGRGEPLKPPWRFVEADIAPGDLLVMASDGTCAYADKVVPMIHEMKDFQTMEAELSKLLEELKPWDDHSLIVYEH